MFVNIYIHTLHTYMCMYTHYVHVYKDKHRDTHRQRHMKRKTLYKIFIHLASNSHGAS